jgi:hypothetical protein
MVDATIVEVSRQRNTREHNAQIKAGQTPDEWKEQPGKLAQKDVQARWTKKHHQTHYGYKNHVKVSEGTKLIMDYRVSAASVRDCEELPKRVGEADRAKRCTPTAATQVAPGTLKNREEGSHPREGRGEKAARRHLSTSHRTGAQRTSNRNDESGLQLVPLRAVAARPGLINREADSLISGLIFRSSLNGLLHFRRLPVEVVLGGEAFDDDVFLGEVETRVVDRAGDFEADAEDFASHVDFVGREIKIQAVRGDVERSVDA